ncbi:hypothetical protein TSAR_001923 [Trichomalopsis sarcophagae]|uniref:Aminotransferase class I/classII large domain-containing protein n=1 Tax=Trichomalopsis sarcophagae TaxID=543379 RepID=A0A232FJZ6_9HYME|nr:hypothetical protein TSAR_001923 [Trichomalopsis sarcophagae]
MCQKTGRMSACAFLILMVTWISESRANKFDFPAHLVGTNSSVTDGLESFIEQYNPVDLGVDMLDEEAPMHIKEALVNATLSHDPIINQMIPYKPLPRFARALAKFYSPLLGREVIAEEEMIATVGATGGVFDAIQGHTSPGDEWIIIQPAYTMYVPMIKMAHGVPRYTNLVLRKRSGKISSQDWVLDREQMESLFNNKTKGIILNNPLNPLGKVYTLEELEFIAGLAKKYDTLVVSDEAHEFITHKPHIRIASLPGMWERTIAIGSSSKSFNVAGFRVGWAYGSANILNNLKAVHARAADCAPFPQQQALAVAFEQELRDIGNPNSFFENHRRDILVKRNTMVEAFEKAGMRPIVPDGSFCLIADWTTLKSKPLWKTKDAGLDFVKWLVKNVGVFGLPVSSFYSEGHEYLGENFVRYCYQKSYKTINTAVEKLRKLQKYR